VIRKRWVVIAQANGRTVVATRHWTRIGARSFALEMQRVNDIAGNATRYDYRHLARPTTHHAATLPAFKGPHDSVTD
jgi:hypothetical protein